MFSLTVNEARIIDFLVRNFMERYSINALARKLEISHTGVHKILRKLERVNVVKPEKIGNSIYYKVNLDEGIGVKIAEFVIAQNELNSYAKVIEEDFKVLEPLVQSCILFGSVLQKGREARDIDVLLVFEKKNFKKVHQKLEEIREMKPKKIHDVMMTKEDLVKNIRKNDEVVLDIIKNGRVLWDSGILVEGIKNGTS
ncbi:MAG: winged helix-turn-helix domain-containing protein [Nanoarchaeota archaeon]